MSKFSLILVLLLVGTFSSYFGVRGARNVGKKWAVIVAGAQGYYNYFSQSNTCHAYHVIRNGGIPPENIIHLNYDDVADSQLNPYKNNLVNTLGGPNIYPGCQIDYRGKDVIVDVFASVMTGNKTGIEVLTGKPGKVLESGPLDEVFLFMNDHGYRGGFDFPTGAYLTTSTFINIIQRMAQQQMYRQMAILVDSCNSGSMFSGHLPDTINVYAIACAQPWEPGYLNCFDEKRNVYLSSVFSHSWSYTTAQVNRDKETLHQLYEVTYEACTSFSSVSHPQQYGNTSLNNDLLEIFLGFNAGTNKSLPECYDALHSNSPDEVREKLKVLFDGIGMKLDEEFAYPEFLIHPPIDMVHIATAIRSLLTNTLKFNERQRFTTDLKHFLKVKSMAEELTKAIVYQVTGNYGKLVDKTDSVSLDSNQDIECYHQGLRMIESQCAIFDPHHFPFIRRSFQALIVMCRKIGRVSLMEIIAHVTSTSSLCKQTYM